MFHDRNSPKSVMTQDIDRPYRLTEFLCFLEVRGVTGAHSRKSMVNGATGGRQMMLKNKTAPRAKSPKGNMKVRVKPKTGSCTLQTIVNFRLDYSSLFG